MFKKTRAVLLLGSALLLGGCIPGASKTVRLTCTAPLNNIVEGMEMKITITAPAEDEPIDSIVMEETVYYGKMLEAMAPYMPDGSDISDDGDMKEAMDEIGDFMISTVSQQYDIPKNRISMKTEDDRFIFTIAPDDPQAFMEKVSGSDVSDDDMVFEKAAKNLEQSMTCE